VSATVTHEREWPSRSQWAIWSVIVALVLMLGCLMLAGHWFRAFAHVPTADIYLMLFFGTLALFVATLGYRLARSSVMYEVLISAVIGHALAVVAVTLTHLLQPNGAERFANTFTQVGVLQMLAIYLVFTLPLAGWLFGPLVVLLARWLSRRRLFASEIR